MKKSPKRVPIVQQIEAAECGAASLCMILGYYGRYVELSEMRRACRISRDGTSLKNIMDAAAEYGLEAKSYRTRPKNLVKLQFPLIVFWKNRHYLVVEHISAKKVVLCDPANGRRWVTPEEFDECYSGIVLQLTPGKNFTKGGTPYSQERALGGIIAKSPTVLIYLSLLLLILNIVGLIIPEMTSVFMDYYFPSLGYTDTRAFLTVFLIVTLIQLALLVLRKRIVLGYERALSESIYRKIYSKLLKLPFDYFQSRSHFSMLSRICSIDTLADFLAVYLVPLSLGLVFSLIYVVLLMTYSIKLGFMVLGLIIPVVFFMLLFTYQNRQDNLRNENLRLSFTGNVIQSFNIFDTIKASALENEIVNNSIRAYIDYQNALQKTKARTAILNAISAVLPLLIQAVTIVIGCNLTLKGEMTLGATLACQSLAMSIFGPISSFINGMASFQKQDANTRGLYDIEKEDADPFFERSCVETTVEYDSIRVEGVSFAYNTSEEPVLHDISFQVKEGGSVAIVGGTGSGKSTLLKLIEGLYSPMQGDIFYNDIPLMQTDPKKLTQAVATVSQQSYVFSGTIRDNITLFNNDISDERILQALHDACIYEEIMERKGGLDQLIENGNSSFSGGQIQRLMLARALVRNPQILILDEATSALDSIVEEQVMNNIKTKGMTLVIVAHRLSTIRDCDEILVLGRGTISERGTHETLLELQNSEYRKLVLSGEDE